MLSNIQHIYSTKENLNFRGLNDNKQIWFLKESDNNLKRGAIVAIIDKDDVFFVYPEYRKVILSFIRKEKLQKLWNLE